MGCNRENKYFCISLRHRRLGISFMSLITHFQPIRKLQRQQGLLMIRCDTFFEIIYLFIVKRFNNYSQRESTTGNRFRIPYKLVNISFHCWTEETMFPLLIPLKIIIRYLTKCLVSWTSCWLRAKVCRLKYRSVKYKRTNNTWNTDSRIKSGNTCRIQCQSVRKSLGYLMSVFQNIGQSQCEETT